MLTSPLLQATADAQTLPTGGSVAAGSAVIAQPSASSLTVTQSSQSAVANWQSFSVGQGNSVTFVQPNASSAILNRVTGSATSNIAGSITANGQVYLVNPNGIAITKTGTVNAGGGFVASTLGISDSDFMAGKRTFTGNGSSAGVSNAGTISVGRGGYAALIGGTVSNAGSIDVPLGKVGLGSGERATLDFSGDGFLQVAVPTSAGGKGALIKNSGSIKADGGSVIISAATAREAARNAVNISGTVQARSIGGRSGSIVIGGGGGGSVRVTGRLDTSSRRHAGGTIQVTGRDIKLKGTTLIASGKTGGGTINIGGGYQGTGNLQRAETVKIDAATTIKADARETGNGGNVVVWSDSLTTFAGTISARGGALSGNGGDAEVSGKAKLDYTGFTDLRATNGAFGTLLLDPYNVIISNGTNNTGGSFDANTNDSVISAATLNNALASANVTITTGSGGSQAGNITVAAPIAWSSGTMLTLTAANAIAVNAPITINGGGQLALNTATTTVGNTTQPLLSFGGGASVTFASNANQSNQRLFINGNSYTLVYTMAQLDAIDGQLATSGGGTVAAYGTGLGGRYALAGDFDTAGTTYTDATFTAAGNAQPFSGTLEGLGHTISNLTISPGNLSVGLIGYLASGGTVRDLGMVGGSISGNNAGAGGYAGGLVGYSAGTVTQSYATGTVSNGQYAGGLVGVNLGTITQSYATGTVSNTYGAGGLVGVSNGTITQSYATGAVSAPTAGGLVGLNYSSIAQSFATGTVSGSGSVGGLVGYNQGGNVSADSYWDTQTSGRSTSAGGTGVTTAELASATTLLALNNGGVFWGNAGNKTTPYLLNNLGPVILATDTATAPTAPTFFYPILTQANLEAVNNNPSRNYVLANNLDLSGTTYTGAVITSYSGTLDGLGNTIANLTINASGDNVGLIGTLNNSGTVRNIGIVGGTISGGYNVGGLIGVNLGGSITQAYTTTAVIGSGNDVGGLVGANLRGSMTQVYATGTVRGANDVGGLVGYIAGGSITQAYATGAVSGSGDVGGLVGYTAGGSITQAYATGAVSAGDEAGGLVGSNNGSIAQAYATGAVSVSGGNSVGGLVGTNSPTGSITQAYATGVVSGSNVYIGGLVGSNYSSSITQSYWDTQTSGQPTNGVSLLSSSGVTGYTTRQLQGLDALPGGGTITDAQHLGAAFAGGTGGLYPYLTSIFANGVQAVSGFAYSDAGLTARPGVGVGVIANGTTFANVSTGANGYYYAFAAAGTAAGGNNNLLAYTNTSATLANVAGASVANAGNSTLQAGVNLYGNAVTVPTSALLLSQAPDLAAAKGLATSAAGNNATALAAITNATGRGLIATGASFEINQAVTTANAFVVQTTASGAPITVSQPITISAGGSLGLYAAGALAINSNITINGAGSVALAYDQNTTTPSPADLSFGLTGAGFTGGLTYLSSTGQPLSSSASGTLSINGNPYTLIYSMADLDGIDGSAAVAGGPITNQSAAGGLSGRYAFARNLFATSDGSATGTPTAYTDAIVAGQNGNQSFSGMLEGLGHTIANLTINAGNSSDVGLVGMLVGGTVRDIGIVGGSVSGGSNVGGLVGENDGGSAITQAYATGAVSGNGGFAGGLVGYNLGSIAQAYATGAVRGSNANYLGGLVGYNGGGITQAYATGAVSGSGNYVGGLVGYNASTITQTYATGAVGGGNYVGGLVGINGGIIAQAYATGAVSGSGNVGGLVGLNSNTVTQAYWDTQTSGRPVTGVGSGSSSGIAGLTTAQLQSNTNGFMSQLGSSFAGGTGGLYPYLTNFFPNGVQAVTGFAYTDAGLTARSGASVGVIAGGTAFATASTGANGYYYAFGAPGSIANNASVLAYANTSATLTTASGATLQTGVNLYGNAVTVPTSATSLAASFGSFSGAVSAARTAALAADGNNAAAAAAINGATGVGLIASGASFAVDAPVNTSGTFLVQTTASGAPITVSRPITISAGGSLGLYAAGALAINANITVNGAGSVALAYDQNTTTPAITDLSFGLTGSGFTGSLTFAGAGGKLAINGNPYTLLYTMADLDGIDGVAAVTNGTITNQSAAGGLSGRYALAGNLNASGTTYTDAIIAGQNGNQIFSGALEGLGHTIQSLTIASSMNYVGLLGSSRGTVRDVGVVGGNVNGASSVGGLVGNLNNGSITQVYATGTVSGNAQFAGGLVGFSGGASITQAYATGAVNGSSFVGGIVGYFASGSMTQTYAMGAVNGSSSVGGLVGYSGGNITQAYATGAVSGSSFVGGLVGANGGGNITQVYATGAVSGTSNVGGLAGGNGGSIVNGYYDAMTTGQPAGLQADGSTGLTTAQLQGALPSGFVSSAWSTGTGLYPYLVNFFPNGAQAVSGFAYKDAGATPAASGVNGAVMVSVLGNGAPFGKASTGTNGYYYVFGQAGAIASGSSLVAYTQANNATGAKDAVTYTLATADANNGGLNVYGGWRLDRPASNVASLSALNTAFTAAAGSSPAASFTLANRDIRIASPSFSLDTAINLTGTLALNSTGSVTQSAAIGAGALSLTGTAGGFTLTNAGNAVATIAANTGSVAFADSVALATGNVTSTGNTITAGVTTTGAVSLATTGNLTLAAGAPVSGTSPVLSTGGAFINNAGASGVAASSGRFLVWSQDTANDTVGGLSYAFRQYNATFGTTSVAGSGNGLLYTLAPTAQINANSSFDRPYDKSLTTRTLTSAGIYISSGGVTGDTVSAVTGATGTFGAKDVGSNIPVSIANSSLVFADANGKPVYGYQFTSNITGNITQKLLSISLSVQNKVYDGLGTASFVLSSADVLAGDTVTFTAGQAPAFGNRNVGTYTLQAIGITLGGPDAANYAPSNSGAAANASITRRPLTIAADAQSRAYGDPNPPLTYSIGGLGLANGETMIFALATTATTASAAGVYPITQGTLPQAAGTFRASNYTITFIGNNLTVTAAPVQPLPTNTDNNASLVARDNFYPAALPDNATPIFGAAPVLTSLGTGTLYADPRSDSVFICFGGGFGTAQSCYAGGR